MNADSYKKQTRDRPLFTFQSNIVKQDNEHKPKARQRVLFGLIKPNEKEFLSSISTRKTKEEAKQQKRKGKRLGTKKRRREGVYNQGRWTVEEHRRFIEALLKYGNDWKNVQKHVSTRTSTQARSHAQKFFVKIGQIKIDDLQLDFTNNSLKSLNMMANNFSADQLEETLKALNKINFAKRVSNRKDSGPSISSGDGFDFHAITSLKKKKIQIRKQTMKSKKKEKIEESKPVDEDEESEGSIQDMRDIFLTQLSKQRRCSYDITWPMLNFNDPNSTYKGKGIFKDCKEDEKHFKNIFESSFQSKETFDEEKFNEFLFLYEDSKAKSKNEKGRKFSISERKLDFYDDFLI